MNLRADYHDKNNKPEQGGFSIFELLIVIAASTVLAAITVPIGFRFFQTQTLDEAKSSLVSTLRRAQGQAVFAKNDSAFGVKILPSSHIYILYQGESYISRVAEEDEEVPFPASIVFSFTGSGSGVDEFSFSKLAGTTTAGTISLSLGNLTEQVDINSEGRIE